MGSGNIIKARAERRSEDWLEAVKLVAQENSGSIILSNPSEGNYRVTNLYVQDNKLKIEYDDTIGETSGSITSVPPQGGYRVANIFVNSSNGRLQIEYDQT